MPKNKLTRFQRCVIRNCIGEKVSLQSYINGRGVLCFKGIQNIGSVLYLSMAGRCLLNKKAIVPGEEVDGVTTYKFAPWALEIVNEH